MCFFPFVDNFFVCSISPGKEFQNDLFLNPTFHGMHLDFLDAMFFATFFENFQNKILIQTKPVG